MTKLQQIQEAIIDAHRNNKELHAIKAGRVLSAHDFDLPFLTFQDASKTDSLFGFPIAIDPDVPKNEIWIGKTRMIINELP